MKLAAIDAGGTSVRVRIVDTASDQEVCEWKERAAPDGGPDPAVALLQRGGGMFDSICAGVAGVSRGGLTERWARALAAHAPPSEIHVVPDWRIALEGALLGGDGVLLQSGTGSIAVARSGANWVRVGGRGWEYGDEGSGGHATAEAIRRTLRALDGLIPATRLTTAIAMELATTTADSFGESCRERARREGRGFLLPVLIRLAEDGNEEAQGLLTGMAGWMARLVVGAARQVGFADFPPSRIAYAGGMRAADPWVLPTLETVLRRTWPGVATQEPLCDALEGAVRIARTSLPGNATRG
ncbi:MAG: BadF/BadG/BcrA/BcrD ATPase family protein [Armatimonadota bacterium]